MSFRAFILVFLAACAFATSCRELTDEKYISEGIIEFDITYPEADQNSLLAGLMPDKMIMKFKDDKIAYDMTGGLGMFKTTVISDPKKRTVTQLVKVMNKKFALVFDSTEVRSLMSELPVNNVALEEKNKMIAGYMSHKAVVTLNDPKKPQFNVFYTKDINLKEPNWSTPFKPIDGVLLEYQMKKYNIEMRFTATSVIKANIEDSTFVLPADYKIVSKREMDDLFQSFN